jgi:hypothetical protein
VICHPVQIGVFGLNFTKSESSNQNSIKFY